MIPPRKFGAEFCKKYLGKYFSDDGNSSEDLEKTIDKKGLADLFFSKKKSKKIIIDYNDLLKHFISDLLLVEVKSAGLNVNNFKSDYEQFIQNPEFKNDYTNNAENYFGFEKDDYEQFLEIYNDKDTQRIMVARTIKELLGLTIITSGNDEMSIFRRLVTKFKTLHGDLVEFEGKQIKSPLCVAFVSLIYQKITTSNPRGRGLDEMIGGNFDFSQFKHYSGDN